VKAVVWYGENNIKIIEKKIPSIKADEILIKVIYVGICGSDIHLMKGWSFKPPKIFGHEFSGEICQIGSNVKSFNIGEKVVAHPWGPCGECYFCRSGKENFCENPYNILNCKNGGAFAEFVVVKSKQVYKLPENISLKKAALIEPISIAIHSFDLSKAPTSFSTVILGGGPIGLLLLQIAKLSGSYLTILSETSKDRRKIAKSIGADVVIDPTSSDLEKNVLELTNGYGVDLCFEAVGIPVTVESSMNLVKKCGTIVLVGESKKGTKVCIDHSLIGGKELTIKGSFWSPYSFYRSINIINKLDLDEMIKTFEGLNNFLSALEYEKKKIGGKVLIKP